ncbi:hypothetical protein F444_17590 [Phytophthora nicotianae P1976]|uniref:Uncharacterized protein n=1 Tax=Phytophthora nicotianae P1976 TaxID=1317066 RepID=A0A080ZEG3_PHYNI|nr:hypothetical protein F444_17590 [Phytophthora nicotianae P1976]
MHLSGGGAGETWCPVPTAPDRFLRVASAHEPTNADIHYIPDHEISSPAHHHHGRRNLLRVRHARWGH